ncbi:hypothetical protein [Chryseobacterium indologenes]|uniref:Uncharacterized protein n=1 Tax=Chryseobacterium indologenes TaxID=253 RepID=A0A0N0IVZ6_CHRID|nr:hypothetical protein [Chryseobacterium indologenes]KPE50963.1 hypothetical protein AOB46_12275 [Chryseobacterium indologenes]
MYSISTKISISKKALIEKSTFTNDETSPSVMAKFICCDCSHENTVEIIPYQSGFPVFQLYHEDKILSKNALLQNGMAAATPQEMLHFGELTVGNLPTLYFGTSCKTCPAKYIGIFSYGEKQPGLTVLQISGIWKYEEIRH